MSEVICRRFLVSGRVQGVFFRASTADKAREMDISGHAINLSDGLVEVLACGPKRDIDRLGEWLTHGPAAARVDDLLEEDIGPDLVAGDGFRTG
ncbi:MAG: acylphosphatase [Gammaproteobacteria bacterium]